MDASKAPGTSRGPLHSALCTLPAFLVLVGLSGCHEAFTTDVALVAEAGNDSLTVDRLSEIFAQGKALAVQRTVVERVARLWVDYSLFAERTVAGDSLLDSATVLATLWPEVHQRVADHFHEGLIARQTALDSSRIDSAYAAGDYRLIEHVLVRTDAKLTAPAREARRKKADEIRNRLASGGSWAEANRGSEDTQAKANGGSLGVVTRGELPASFETAAFSLKPGGISEVVETPAGFHIIRRPPLRERRAAFISGVQERLVSRMDSIYLAGLAERRHMKVRGDAPPLVRAALADPLDATSSTRVLGTFDGGRFTVGDLLRWINAMPAQVEEQLSRAGDGQIENFVRSLMRNHALMVEADSAGVRLTALDLQEFREMLRSDLGKVRKALNLNDKLVTDTSKSVVERQRQAALYIDNYLDAVAGNKTAFVSVPPFLAARLRQQTHWRVMSAGVQRVLERSNEIRSTMDSLRPEIPSAPRDTVGGSNGKR